MKNIWAVVPPIMGVGVGVGFGFAAALLGSGDLAAGSVGVATGLTLTWCFRKLLADTRPALPDGDDGSGDRPVWTRRETERLSAHHAWLTGQSALPGLGDTREMPRPEPHTVAPSRHRGRRRAGAR